MKKLIVVIALVLIVVSQAAQANDIFWMAYGTKKLSLKNNIHIMTTSSDMSEMSISPGISPDGRYVFYSDTIFTSPSTADSTLYTQLISTGKQYLIMKYSDSETEQTSIPADSWSLMSPGISTEWSPDGKLLVFGVHRLTDIKTKSFESAICLSSPTGLHQEFIKISDNDSYIRNLSWSPDGNTLALLFNELIKNEEGNIRSISKLFVYNLYKRQSQTFSSDGRIALIRDWSEDGKRIKYIYKEEDKPEQITAEYDITSGKSNIINAGKFKAEPNLSPNKALQYIEDKDGIKVKDINSEESINLLNEKDASVLGWTPDSSMIVYQTKVTITDKPANRSLEMHPLWLLSMASGKLNHMCVAPDNQAYIGSAWLNDILRVAYISNNGLNIAEIKVTDLDAFEKAQAGLPLTEDEEKEVITSDAKQVGLGIMMYTDDYEGKMPPDGDYMNALLPYTKNEDLFNRPGTSDLAFEPVLGIPNINEIEEPAEFVIGTMKSTYGWKVIIYADGHVKYSDN